MAIKKSTVDKYLTTITVLRHKLNTGENVVRTAFIKEWKVSTNLFRALRDMDFIAYDGNDLRWIGPVPTVANVTEMLEYMHTYVNQPKDKTPEPTLDDISKQLDARLSRIEKILEHFVA